MTPTLRIVTSCFNNPPKLELCKDAYVKNLTITLLAKPRWRMLYWLVMTKLTREDVLKLAQLARLQLTDDEVEEFASEFSEILAYVEQLQGVNTEGLKPTHQVSGNVNVMRDDAVVEYGYDPKDLLKNVPAIEDDHIKVKRMVN